MSVACVKTDGLEMEYIKFGRGSRSLVIIPGLGLKSVIESSASIEQSYSAFAEDYTIYLFDRKKNIGGAYSIENMADDTAAAMKMLCIENACVFGTSQGGMIAMVIAIKYPELVSKLVLGSTAASADAVYGVINNWICLAQSGKVRELVADFIDRVYSAEFSAKYKNALVEMYKDTTYEELERFVVLAGGCSGFDVTDELEKIRCPVLVLGSEKDRVISPDAMHFIAEKLGCEIYMYEGFGHAVYDETPDYKSRISGFFA